MILVIGATGKIGAEVVKQLLGEGREVRAMARNPESARQRLGPRVEIVAGDLAAPETLGPAMAGVERLFLLCAASPDHVALKSAGIQAAARAGVAHVVLSTGITAGPDSPVELGRWHGRNQEELKATGMAWTFLQPTYFMQNMLWLAPGIARDGHFSMPLGDSRIAWVDVRDIAAVGVAALTGDGHAGQAYPITGGAAISCTDMASILSEVCAKPIRFVDQSLSDARAAMLAAGGNPKMVDLNIEFYALAQTGKLAEVSDVVARVSGRPPRSFGEFAADYAAAFGGR